MLTLGWSDGATFMPIDFSLFSSKNSQINGISSKIDKRSSGYKCRLETLQKAPEQIPDMIDRAMKAGIDASYVLMDTWFTLHRIYDKNPHLKRLQYGILLCKGGYL